MIHELKINPEFFDAVASGIKTFEVRKNDRPFRIGDTLVLLEFDDSKQTPSLSLGFNDDSSDPSPAGSCYTGRETRKTITYILDDKDYCLNGFVILGIKHLPEFI